MNYFFYNLLFLSLIAISSTLAQTNDNSANTLSQIITTGISIDSGSMGDSTTTSSDSIGNSDSSTTTSGDSISKPLNIITISESTTSIPTTSQEQIST